LQVLGYDARENVRARPDNDFDRMAGEALRLRHDAVRWRECCRNSDNRNDKAASAHGLTPYAPSLAPGSGIIMVDDRVG
jgi:hypothetical protein